MNSDTSLTINHYKILLSEPPLGKGTFGTVYNVIDTRYNVTCVAKSISKKYINDRGLGEQIRNEMTIHKNLKHKNIVRYLDQFSNMSDIFIILEKCNSETLEKLCENYMKIFKKQISLRIAQHFLIQVAEAVSFMHSKGIAHRDLKLENIMLKFEDEVPLDQDNTTGYFYYNNEFTQSPEKFEELMLTSVVKIIDLGFAKQLDSKGCAKSFLGTPAYLAPEILKKKSSDYTPDFAYSSKVDTWAIGVLALQMITGDVPITITNEIRNFKDLYALLKKREVLYK